VVFLLAYVDPGTGSFILQAVAGAVMGVGYMVRGRIRSLASKLRGRRRDADDTKPGSE